MTLRSDRLDSRGRGPLFHGVVPNQDSTAVPSANSALEKHQQEMFDSIAQAYEAHYSDEYSLRYRELFLVPPLVKGLSLEGAHVLDALCGSGQMTGFLQAKGARVTGLDLSPELTERFRKRFPECEVRCGSVLDMSFFPEAHFDHVFITGGLHHIQPHIDTAVREVARVLKPGGFFCFIEPHREGWPDLIRRLWYRLDRHHFEENERSVDIQELLKTHGPWFTLQSVTYGGGPAYMLVLSSLILRIPLWAKRYYSPLLLQVEKLFRRFHTPRLSCYVVCQLRKI